MRESVELALVVTFYLIEHIFIASSASPDLDLDAQDG